MFGLFHKGPPRIAIAENNIFVENRGKNLNEPAEIEHIFEFDQEAPEIKVFENGNMIRLFKIEPLTGNPNLSGQFLHSSIRILQNSAVMIDGIFSKSKYTHAKWTDEDYEALRLQPFYLSDRNEENIKIYGRGLFDRGLHFNGKITPGGVRCVCICDRCNGSFTIQHFHAGFSEVQYFYSEDGKETLMVPYSGIENLPTQLQKEIDLDILKVVESKLPRSVPGGGEFRYYNPFRCPHCSTGFIDFENNRQIRPGEYYGNTFINMRPTIWPA